MRIPFATRVLKRTTILPYALKNDGLEPRKSRQRGSKRRPKLEDREKMELLQIINLLPNDVKQKLQSHPNLSNVLRFD